LFLIYIQPEEGIAFIALGFGKTVVERKAKLFTDKSRQMGFCR